MKRMKRIYSITLILLLLLFASAGASAQIRGVITDSLTHEPLMYITVQYEGKGVGGISNADGEYQVETRKGWDELTFSAIGYITMFSALTNSWAFARLLRLKTQAVNSLLRRKTSRPLILLTPVMSLR